MGRIGRRVYRSNLRRHHLLDKQLTVRELLKYGGYVVAAVVVLIILFYIPYSLGKSSVECEQTLNSVAPVIPVQEIPEVAAPDVSVENATIDEPEEDVQDEAPAEDAESDVPVEDESYDFAKYSNVNLDFGDVTYDVRGDDWGTIHAVELIIENDEVASIYPVLVNAKIHDKGDSPVDWWDDEVEVNFRVGVDSIYRGDVDLHISFSDLSTEKIITIELRDTNGILIAEKAKGVVLD